MTQYAKASAFGGGGGGSSSPVTTEGDVIVGNSSGEEARLAIGTNGQVLTSNGTTASWQDNDGAGDVVGPASATDNAIARYDSTTGKLLQNSGATIDDSGNLTANNISGTNTGDQTSVSGTSGNTDALNSATTTVDVSAATAPTSGQVLTATSGTAATWQTPSSGFADPMTTDGDIIVRNASNTTVRLPAGTSGQLLTTNGSAAAPSWETVDFDSLSPMTTAGDIIYGGASGTGTRLAAGTAGGVLTTLGPGSAPAWSPPLSFDALSPMTTGGDIIYGGASGAGTRLANGSAGQVLTSAGGTSAPTWSTPAAIATSSDNRLTRYNGTSDVQGSGITVDDSDNVSGMGTLSSGAITSSGDIKTTAGQIGSASEDLGTVGATETINWNNGNVQYLIMDVNLTLSFSNPVSGHAYTLILKQDGSGTNSVTWPANVTWPGGTAPTITTTANAVDVVTLIYNNEDSLDEY